MQHQKTWTITQIHEDGERDEVARGISQAEALLAVRRAMYGDAESAAALTKVSVHELPLAA